MALLYSKSKPGKEGLYLLEFLKNYLDDSYEIFFQPFLNGDRPDIIIMRKDYGVMIIEVKDWKFQDYYIDKDRNWRIKQNDEIIKSPVDQVTKYKQNIFNLYIGRLLGKRIANPHYYGIVNCAVYFHNENKSAIEDFIIKPFSDQAGYMNKLSRGVDILGRDDLTENVFENLLKKRRMTSAFPSRLFDQELYASFRHYICPPQHKKDEAPGKANALAERVVNAHLRHNDKVLILADNISLKNYIHDMINDVKENFSWENFYINEYHNFINSELNNLGIQIVLPEVSSSWSDEKKAGYKEENYYCNIELFRKHKDNIQKYKTILINEAQYNNTSCLEIIKECFLEPGGECVFYGDETEDTDIKAEQVNYVFIPAKEKADRIYDIVRNVRNAAVLGSDIEKLKNFDCYYRARTNENTNVMFETKEVYYKLLLDRYINTSAVRQGLEFIKGTQPDDQKTMLLAVTITKKMLADEFSDDEILCRKFNWFLKRHEIDKQKFNDWFRSKEFQDILCRPETGTFKDDIKNIRFNKQFNFRYDRNAVNISAVQNFKGFKADTVILLNI